MEKGKKPNKPKKKPSQAMLITLAKEYAGVITDMAKAYGCSRQAMAKWCKGNEKIKDAMEEGRDVLVDLAKAGLKHHLENKSEKSIHYTLDRLARHEGFGQHISTTDKSKFEDQLDELSDQELMDMMNRNDRRIKEGQ